MFQGTIPAPMRSIVLEHAREWRADDVYVPCSGTFTSERILSTLERFRLFGNDVTLYSCVLGWWMAGEPVDVRVRDEHEEVWGWLERYLATPADAAATVVLASSVPLPRAGRSTNAYFERLRSGYVQQWPELHAKTKAKLQKAAVRLDGFHAGDAVDWIDEVPGAAAVVSFPPFYAGGYETMFAAVSDLFEWPAPEYPEMDEERRELFLERAMGKREWLLATHKPLDGAPLRGTIKPGALSVTFYVYSSGGPSRIFVPREPMKPLLVPYLLEEDELGDRLAIAPLQSQQFARLRSAFLDSRITTASAGSVSSFAVLCDGKVIGAFAFTNHHGIVRTRGLVDSLPQPAAYLMSDFSVAPTRYRHLSKLVLMAATSKEAQLLMERSANHRIRSLVTTAFSDRPTSMKYRNVFRQLSRREGKDGEPHAYVLNYGAPIGQWTLEEALDRWKTKHGEQVT